MTNIYIVSIEICGDGSSNWTENNRPGISVYTDQEAFYSALATYLTDCDLTLTRKIFQDIIKQGGLYIDDDHKIRLDTNQLNPGKLMGNHWYNWNLPNSVKSFEQLQSDIPNREQIGNAFINNDTKKINQYLQWGLDVYDIGSSGRCWELRVSQTGVGKGSYESCGCHSNCWEL